MKFHFRYSVAPEGEFIARCLEIFSCSAHGRTLEELKLNAGVALRKFLTVPPGNCIYPAPPSRVKLAAACDRLGISVATVFTIPVGPGAALALSLRKIRSHHRLYQSDVAKRLEMRSHSAYQRLEDPLRANPTLETLARLRRVFPNLDVENLFEPEN